MADTADLGHLLGRVPHAAGNPARAEREHEAHAAAMHHDLAARELMRHLADGDKGAALRHINSLRRNPDIDAWQVMEAMAGRAGGQGPAAPPQG
jgi:hypothetical protein